MLHEQFTCWLLTLHKIILAHHHDNCECDCGFCVSCGELDTLSIGGFIHLMPTISSLPWSATFSFSVVFMDSCNLCHSNKLESLFECPVLCLLYDEEEVEFWMYEPIDLTEQSTTNSATGATMQDGRLFFFCLYLQLRLLPIIHLSRTYL